MILLRLIWPSHADRQRFAREALLAHYSRLDAALTRRLDAVLRQMQEQGTATTDAVQVAVADAATSRKALRRRQHRQYGALVRQQRQLAK